MTGKTDPSGRGEKKRKKTTAPGEPPLLSLHLIARNEEAFIARCLESVKGLVDEMIVLDTGSTDRTVEIAESCGAKVYHHPWQDSFSEARNEALKYATAGWILQLDADEELDKKDGLHLRSLVRDAKVNSFFLPIYNYLPDGAVSRFYYRRLFRRGCAHYEGRVHNQLIAEGAFGYAEIKLWHHGYNLSPEKMAAKYRRSENLLLTQIREDPGNPFHRFNLARIYRNRQEYDKAIQVGMEALEMKPYEEHRTTYYMALFDVAYCMMMVRDFEGAKRLCREGLKMDPKNLDLRFTHASTLAMEKRYDEAIKEYQRFLRELDKSKRDPGYNLNTLIVDTWSFEDKALNNIGQCLGSAGRTEEAVSYYRARLSDNPECPIFYIGLSAVFLHMKRTGEAAGILKEAVASGHADWMVFFRLGEIYREMGQAGEAKKAYLEALQLKGDPQVYNGLGVLYLAEGETEKAEEAFLKLLVFQPDHIGAMVQLVACAEKNGDKHKAAHWLGKLKKKEIEEIPLLKELGTMCLKLGLYEKAVHFYEKYLYRCPLDARIMANIAGCYARLGCIDSAKLGYRAALTIEPEYVLAKQNLEVLERIAE